MPVCFDLQLRSPARVGNPRLLLRQYTAPRCSPDSQYTHACINDVGDNHTLTLATCSRHISCTQCGQWHGRHHPGFRSNRRWPFGSNIRLGTAIWFVVPVMPPELLGLFVLARITPDLLPSAVSVLAATQHIRLHPQSRSPALDSTPTR